MDSGRKGRAYLEAKIEGINATSLNLSIEKRLTIACVAVCMGIRIGVDVGLL